MNLQKVYKQPMIRRKWSVTNPSKAMRVLHKVTFGWLGAIPMTELTETYVYKFYTGAPQQPIETPYRGKMNHVNCRCETRPFITKAIGECE